MSHEEKKTQQKRKYTPRRLSPGQRLLVVMLLLVVLALCSTMFLDLRTIVAEPAATAAPDWEAPIQAYVLAAEGELTAPFYNEGLAVASRPGRGTEILLESWVPLVTESGDEYYHAWLDGETGYIPCANVTDDQSALLQESQLYVRTAVDLLQDRDGIQLGSLAERGTLLRIIGYDYFKENGAVNRYNVRMGEESGWIQAEYVTLDYAESMENWSDPDNYVDHAAVGDTYGGGDAGGLDYWPHEKGDFADEGNVMPESVYALYIPAYESSPEKIAEYLSLAEGSSVNAFVFTIFDEGEMAYYSPWLEQNGLLDVYTNHCTVEEFTQSVQMVRDAGYYAIARITVFRDGELALAHPEWAIADIYGAPMLLNDTYWPTVYSRDVWELKVGLAVEVADTFSFNEIQFDYVRFPDWIINYEEEGTVDLRNTYGESKAQAVQRFLTYATDVLHDHGVYVAADVFGETSNSYVAPYGQYWPAITNVVDVICGMPYPDHFSSYYSSTLQGYYVPYKHPYEVLNSWAGRVNQRQQECASPAIVRTWIQTWDDADYEYNALAIQRQIVALYDADITGGYMLWHGNGSLYKADVLPDAIEPDYYALYRQAQAAGQDLSDYMGMDTGEG